MAYSFQVNMTDEMGMASPSSAKEIFMHDAVEIYLGEGFDESLQAVINSVIKENGGFAVHILDDLDFLEVDLHIFEDVIRLEFDIYSGAIAKGKMGVVAKFANEVFSKQRKSRG